MGDTSGLQRRIADLEHKLSVAEQTVNALVSGEIDTLLRPHDTSTPLLLQAAQEALRANERLFRAVFDGATDAVLISDAGGRYVDANPAACVLFGLPREQLLGRRVVEFAEPHADAVAGARGQLQASGQTEGQFTLVRPDGTRRDTDLRVTANILPGLSLSLLRDMTERRRIESRFRAMVEKSHDGIALLDAAGKTIYISPAIERLVGVPPSKMAGISGMDFVHPDDRDQVAAFVAGVISHPGTPSTHEYRVLHPEDGTRWQEGTACSYLDDPAISAIVCNFRDITAQKQADAALRQSQRVLEDAQHIAHLGSWASDSSGSDTVSWSAECARIFGQPLDAAPTVEGFIQFVHPEDRVQVAAASARALAQGSVRETEHRIVRPTGEVRWVYSRTIVEDSSSAADDGVVGQGKRGSRNSFRVVGVIQDITERKRAEDALRASDLRYRRIVDNTSEGVWVCDAAGTTTYMNPRMTEMLGCTLDDALGQPLFAFMDDAGREAVRVWSARRTPGGAERGEFRLRRRDGSPLWVLLRGDPLYDSAGNLEGSLALITDITASRRAQETRNQLAAIVECSDDAIISMTLNGTMTTWNRGAAALFGYSNQETVGQPISMILPPDRVDEEAAILTRLAAGESIRHFETVRRRKDGSLCDVSLSLSPIMDAAGTIVGVAKIARNITERRRADETRNRLASIVASSDDAIVSRGVDGIIRTWNSGAERLTLYTAAEAVGRPISMLYPPEQAIELAATRALVNKGRTLEQFEMFAVRKDGSRVEISLTSSLLTDDEGRVHGASIIARDITERRKSEVALRRSEEQLRQAQKMEAVGSLAGGIAHDFNNVLSVILGYTSLIVDDLKAADPLRADLQQVHIAGLRATELTRQLLAFSRQQVLQPAVVEVNVVVTGIEKMLVRLLREDIQLSLLMAPLPGKVYADPGQLEQVIMNLVVNAGDAMPNGGNLTIETGSVMIEESYAADHAGVVPGPYVMLAVTDTGTGMDAATKDRIFEPFFTTKDKSKGTGLGLSTVYGIVQQSGGHIWVYTELGKGSTFKVYLPQTDRRTETQQPPSLEAAPMRGAETILLVEDEEQVRGIMRTVLRKHGYNVIEAQNGGEAFLLCEQFTARIDMLLTDVVMPRMSGRQLAERLTRLRPEMAVLYVSGYTDDAIVHHGVLEAGIAFLQKPIMPAALLRKVRQVLDSPSPRALPKERHG